MIVPLLRRSPVPILQPDQAWEQGGSLLPVAAFIADGELLLYYVVRFGQRPLDNVLCVARSADAVTWRKPDLGHGTNVVMRASGHENGWGTFLPMSILHEPGEPEPQLRWKMLYWDRPDPKLTAGLCLAGSADGLKWRPLYERPIITGANDAASMVSGRPELKTPFGHGTHLIHQQTFKHNPRLPVDRDNLGKLHRCISVWQAKAYTEPFVGPALILEPDAEDAPDLQFYWLSASRTPRGGYFGLLHCHHTIDQTMDLQLVASEDGWSWRRAFNRQPILPLGPRGAFDCGMVVSPGAPVEFNGRVFAFYHGRPTVHDGKPRFADDPPIATGLGVAEFDSDLFNL
ncbi:MAG: hypothetical protein R3F03_10570 [Opitutaceae bacterium]